MPIAAPFARRTAGLLLAGLAGIAAPAQSPGAAEGPLFVPVYRTNFPDPFILPHGGEYLAYSTNSENVNLPMAVSRDLVSWGPVNDPARPGKPLDAMPVLASWVKEGRTWAPEVIKVGERYLLYYTAHYGRKDLQCLGVAAASDPRGPFVDTSAEPFVCQEALGGTIDAHPFRDADGQLYLYYKNDGNNPKYLKPAQIWAQRLSPDGLKLVGQAVPLVKNDVHWEWRVVEAPTMIRHAEGYTLLFSANHYGWEADQRLSNYGTGYATCEGPLGPCTDAPDNPWLHSFNDRKSGCVSGPGHPAIFKARDQPMIAFHAWAATAGCRKLRDERYLYVAPFGWGDGKPQIGRSLRAAAD